MTQPVRILTVCTGNICRSPVAERLLQAGLDQVLPDGFRVRSAGVQALVGNPIQPPSAAIIRLYGGSAHGFAARQLTEKILAEADIVLTMTSAHRGEVLRLDPSLLKRTFTIREFARMLDALEERDGLVSHAGDAPAASNSSLWRELPTRAASVRHLILADDSADNDVVDPYRRSEKHYREMEEELAPAIISILRYARLNA